MSARKAAGPAARREPALPGPVAAVRPVAVEGPGPLEVALGEALAEALAERDAARAELAAAESRRALLEAAVESLDVGVLVAGPDGRIALVNRTARRWHGTEADAPDAAVPAPERCHVYEVDGVTRLSARRSPLHRALHDGEVSGQEVVIAPPDAPTTTVVCSGRALTGPDGTVLGAAVTLTDVTVDRAREEALRAAHDRLSERGEELDETVRELTRSNADLEEFAAVASHDLSSPLRAVAGYLELLGEVHGHSLDERANEWIDAALRGTLRMQELITALLAHAHAGASEHPRELTEVREVLDQAVLDLRGRLRGTGARVVSDGLPQVHCNPVLLQQLLRHLIGNALDHRSPQHPCRIKVSAELSEDRWVFSVADNGMGIPPGERERLFSLSAMLEQAARTGQGIGLATCQRIVERHGGRIWAEDGASGGTVIRFTIPQRQPGRN
ncbi:PAS domain-containing protein [Kineococcus xinjiangensis]|uniref:histidine kinase n=1 Tax=Kineococcus xinjiangensis TaxID=512762 RepID=A0A2S6IF99_9ACTN|nr:ATP-binding protein [Kineococcus xinjiangensis]PPK92888.1 PAS domain-containing protein [Kineococcus xinjiangensis]